MEASTVPRARRRLKRRTPKRHSEKISNANAVARAMNGIRESSIKVVLSDPRCSRFAQLGVVSNNDHAIVVDGEESTVNNYRNTVTGNRLDCQLTLSQDGQEGRVARQDSDFTIAGAGLHHLGRAGPHKVVRCDNLNLELSHTTWSVPGSWPIGARRHPGHRR